MQGGLIKNESMAVQAYTILKEQVIEGVYHPGDKISEQTVADQLRISRSPVREAIRRLANEGLVDYFPNRGAFVKNYTENYVRDSFEARLILEKYAIGHIQPELRERYREKMERLRDRMMQEERADYNALDAELHETIVRLCGNEVLLNIYRQLYSQILTFREISLVDEAMFHLATLSHIAILDALLSGNDERAKRIITNHLGDSETQVRRFYFKEPQEQTE